MKKLKKLIFFILLTGPVFAQTVGPKITAKNPKFDFGKVLQHRYVSHNFVIFNSGDDTLKIEGVTSSCGCTVAQLTKDELLPGDSTVIKATFNTGNRRGKQRKHIYIYTNDKNNRELRLSFTANVVEDKKLLLDTPHIELSTNRYNFGNAKEGDVLKLIVKVKNTGKKPLIINDINSSCGCTAALMSSKKLNPNQVGDLSISFDTAKREGKISRTVTIFSNDPENPVETITLFVNILKGDN
ncbi:hypothetical protein BMS3Abin04_00590 [bacterium BMS3Abin04]|nr:hypothetical protein BMS3Abin04_00590 [bacterium BMS3Abin04]